MMVLRNYQLKHESFGFWSFWRFWRLGDSDRYQPVRLIFSTPSLTELLVSFHRETNPFHPPLGTISSWILPVEYIKPNIAVEQRLHGLVNVFASRDYSDMRQLPVIVVIVVGGGVVAVTPDTPPSLLPFWTEHSRRAIYLRNPLTTTRPTSECYDLLYNHPSTCHVTTDVLGQSIHVSPSRGELARPSGPVNGVVWSSEGPTSSIPSQ
ncbi:hypothetical protein PG987_005490 [Apiospora arundinis]